MAAVVRPAQDDYIDRDALIDRDMILLWLYWGLVWLMVAPTIGAVISSYFNFPDYLGTSLELQFGRLRPMHINGVIFGAFSSLFIGLCYYIVPRLSGVRVYKEEWGHALAWIWNLNLAGGLLSLMFGYNQGFEAGEFPLPIDTIFFLATCAITVQFLVTIARRNEPQLYVAMWYLIGTFVWTTMNLFFGSFILPYFINGINSAAFHGLFLHYIVGLWITPAGYVLIYYFLPASVKNPIYSHKLSLVGFWS
ncbi:MAG: cbb3-type cytochrome c oxidase subunit I, partial [Burkholderiales bacterium]|nr:cbb3-type cytochrome c oxidase subunit I [Burkholderiales bacterium]